MWDTACVFVGVWRCATLHPVILITLIILTVYNWTVVHISSKPIFTTFRLFSTVITQILTSCEWKKNKQTQQAFLITWPAPYRLELTHGGTSCCFALCEIRHLHTKATCSASIKSVEIFYVCICWRLCATAAALYVVCPRTCNQSKHRVYRTSTWFVYWQWDPVGSVLSRLFTWAPYVKHSFQSRSLLFLTKEDSCRALFCRLLLPRGGDRKRPAVSAAWEESFNLLMQQNPILVYSANKVEKI